MNDLYLIAQFGGESVAFPAAQVEGVVKVREIVPIPGAPPYVIGLFALRSRVLTLIDTRFHVSGIPTELEGEALAIVIQIDGNSYGLIVDEVIDVREISGGARPLHAGLAPGWRQISNSMVHVHGKAMLVAEPALIVGHRDAAAA